MSAQEHREQWDTSAGHNSVCNMMSMSVQGAERAPAHRRANTEQQNQRVADREQQLTLSWKEEAPSPQP